MASKVMKKAWEIYKGQSERSMKKWSESLKKAWAIIKGGEQGMKELRGTEKQIAWAKDIRAKMIAVIDERIEKEKKNIERTKYEHAKKGGLLVVEKFEAEKAKVLEQTDAVWFIDHRDDYPMVLFRIWEETIKR